MSQLIFRPRVVGPLFAAGLVYHLYLVHSYTSSVNSAISRLEAIIQNCTHIAFERLLATEGGSSTPTYLSLADAGLDFEKVKTDELFTLVKGLDFARTEHHNNLSNFLITTGVISTVFIGFTLFFCCAPISLLDKEITIFKRREKTQ